MDGRNKMADLLIELFSEEIPARMQKKASDDLKRMIAEGLKAAGLTFDGADAYVTPRRLALNVTGLPVSTPDVREERRGPRADAPEKAVEGFLRGAGVSRDACEERETPKGTFLFAVIEKKGKQTAEVVADLLKDTIKNFPWPKSQRWGKDSRNAGSLKWVRPLHSILCILDGETIDLEIEGIKSGNTVSGHRFMAPDTFTVSGFDDYKAKLLEHKVMLDAGERANLIEAKAKELAAAKGLEWVEDRGLLAEVAGLVEWPVPLMGGFDPSFMEVPEEVLILTMKKDQKYFVTRDPETGKLAPYFITVANIEPSDGGSAVAAGNERVLSARLSDAKFFWDQDLKGKLDDNLNALKEIVFHKDLGSVHDRVERMKRLALDLGKLVGCDLNSAERAAELAKADLVSNMVYEFPEVQGAMGRYYALKQGESDAVADAIRDHYSPLGPNDECPTAPVSVAVALAEKLDTLVGFFGIGQKPTGSKDPFALRRAALGVIRLITENNIRLSLADLFDGHLRFIQEQMHEQRQGTGGYGDGQLVQHRDGTLRLSPTIKLLSFFADRLKVQQREKGVRHDLIDAVFANGDDDLVRVLTRVNALTAFLNTDDGANLLAGYKRAANILKIEEKKDDRPYDGAVDADLLESAEEKTLADALKVNGDAAKSALEAEDFEGAMAALAKLRAPIDAFFEAVIVNADDAAIRTNRLNILNAIRGAVNAVADFEKIEG
jgi:glycyl-tRNA synthetase beta chain